MHEKVEMIREIFWVVFFFWVKNTVALFKSNREGSGSVIGVKQERLLEVRTEFTVSIEATERQILYFLLMFIFRVVAETYLFKLMLRVNKYHGDVNCISCLSWEVEGLFRSSQKNELKQLYSDQCKLSFILCTYLLLKCTPEGSKDISPVWWIRNKRYFLSSLGEGGTSLYPPNEAHLKAVGYFIGNCHSPEVVCHWTRQFVPSL